VPFGEADGLKVPTMIASACDILANGGHIVPALCRVGRLTDRSPLYLQCRFET
jgi:hypothetical protein